MARFDSQKKHALLLAENDEGVARPRQRSYHAERTGSRQIPAVKQRRVSIVPGWVTAWEVEMLLAFFLISIFDFLLAVVDGVALDRQAALANVNNTRAAWSLVRLAFGAIWERENERWAFFHVGGSSSLFVCLAFSSVQLSCVESSSSKRAESIAFVIELVNVVRRVIESRWRRSPFAVVLIRENERPTQKRRETMIRASK